MDEKGLNFAMVHSKRQLIFHKKLCNVIGKIMSQILRNERQVQIVAEFSS